MITMSGIRCWISMLFSLLLDDMQSVAVIAESCEATTLLASELHYLAEQCTEDMHARIASNFTEIVTRHLGTVGGGSEKCAIENVQVACGKRSIILRRRDIVDSVQSSKVPLTVTFAVKVPLPGNASVVGLNQTTQKISSEILGFLNETDLSLNNSGVFLEYDVSKPPVVRIIGPVCDKGKVQEAKRGSCQPGYFLNTSGCQACAVDQYQDQEGQTSCVSCPSGTSTLGHVGSKKPEDCRDNAPPVFHHCPGNTVFYTGNCSSRLTLQRWEEPVVTDNSGQVSITYPSIRPPANLSVGLYNVLYSATDSSGNQANCSFIVKVTRKSCPVLQPPIHGFIASLSCGFAFGSQASLACNTGYQMAGSPLRSCRDDGAWSGSMAICNIVKCPSIEAPSHGMVSPSTCQIPSGVNYKTECIFSCNVTVGYLLEGTSKVSCLESGSWSADTTKTVCRDIQAPNITCPPDMDDIPTEPGQSYAIVNWQLPLPTDNSNETLRLDGLRPPQKMNVGKKHITYKVTDSSGLSISCQSTVYVKDREPPRIANCPDIIYKTSEEKWTKIFFPVVTVTDNVDVHSITLSRQNGSELTWGQHNVTYTASDIAGNTAQCHFQVIIGANRCPDLPTPMNGAKTCDQSPDEKSCILHCHVGYDFANSQSQPYVCSPIKGAWVPSDKVPDCSGTHQAQVVFAIELHYLADKCPKERNARPDSNFIAFYTQYLATLSGWYGNEDCTIESVERPVKCAEPGIRFGRRRIVYSKQGIKVPLSVRIVVKVPLPSNVSFADLNHTTQGLSSNVLTSLETDQPLNISGVVLEHDASKPPDVRVDGLVCDKGQVLKGTKCVNCPRGHFFNSTGCQACAVDYYQDREAQASCIPCPSGKSTLGKVASTLPKDCRETRKPAGSNLIPMISGIIAGILILTLIIASFLWKRYLRNKRMASNPPTTLGYTKIETSVQIENELNQDPPSCNNGAPLNGLPTPFPEYITKSEAIFTSDGGELNASSDSNVRIIVPRAAIPAGINQPVFFGVFSDETPLLQDIPDASEKTLISPVVECGPHDTTFSKPVEIIVPHCLCLSEAKKESITVYRCANFSAELEGRLSWERVPQKSRKTSQPCFIVEKDSIRIKTNTFSLWSIFACGGPRRKRATVFANRPNPQSDLIYLRFYVYSDNEDSKRRVELKDRERFPDSRPAREQPFRMYNESREITVRLTNLEEGWEFDKTEDTQIYHYDRATGNGFRSKNACDFAVKPENGRDVNGFSCMVKFYQEDDGREYLIYLNPGFTPLKRQSIHRTSAAGGQSVTASSNTCPIAGCSTSTGSEEEGEECDSYKDRRSPQDSPREKGLVRSDHFFTSLGLGNDKPVTENLCSCISPYVGANWKLVLRKLSIEEAKIRNLEEDQKNASVQERCYQGLLLWKDNRGPQGAMIKALCDALHLAGCSEALKALQREIAPQSSDC